MTLYQSIPFRMKYKKIYTSQSFLNVFKMRQAPDIVPRTIGFTVTPPSTALIADPILHASSTF